eukprot:NODE_5057_length_723_cov_58.513353_g4694_i0.p2 GENE.NODE_5057_length_723_cov_58.513353_g4694_i0~~NODE_5057_length_723_cov_58.513353_g4694_i0.p2  ORF type:complete len:152 (+),score=27.33 NODE_5057_length_723_cov_58.513353_g4694_i0:82-537(+)
MVKLDVLLKADLENVTNLRLPEDENWYFVLEFEGERKEVYLTPAERMQIPNSRGEACMVLGSKDSNKAASVTFLKSQSYSKSGTFAPIATFECRGCELLEFQPHGGWQCESTVSDQTFEDIDLTEGDWAEYDERGNESVTVYSVQSRIARS